MTRATRIGLIVGLIFWLISSLLLIQTTDGPLVGFKFASPTALVWLISGLLLLASWLWALFGGGSATVQNEDFHLLLNRHINEPVLICDVRGRTFWRNEAANALLTESTLPRDIYNLLERTQQTERVAIQVIPLGEALRYSVLALPLPQRRFALVFRPVGSQSAQDTFYENFIRRIVHDMRNPLAGIIGHAANLRYASEVDPASLQKSAATIETQAQRLARLVDSILFDARLAYVPLTREKLDLIDLIEDAVFAQEERAVQSHQSIEIDAPLTAPTITGDRDLLIRAFENVIDNGLKYAEEGDNLQIRLEQNGSGYVIRFIDHGQGIPPEYLPERIFEPLVRAQSQESGSGLGLSIVKKIVEMHEGSIGVQSKLNQGTTVTITLPTATENKP
ncbi:MAG: HAMP domain-containing histidine kinase [Anaerolineae bacterium]|nr:HAMP domain-containing histidine kinase [Anaerolineae bacterium]